MNDQQKDLRIVCLLKEIKELEKEIKEIKAKTIVTSTKTKTS